MELKMKAARERKSVASVIRGKLIDKQDETTLKERMKLLRELRVFARKMAKKNKGVNLTQAVIDARYEK